MHPNDAPPRNGLHMLHPMVDPKAATEHPPLILEKADGVYVWDVDGRRYLDTVASLWNVNVGHNHPAIKRAITEQLDKLTYWSTFQNTTNPPAIELSARLINLFGAEDMAKVIFSSGGSDAIETALKIARQYWQLEGQPNKTQFISLKWGYHGVHFGGASINGNPLFRTPYEPLLPGCHLVESPYPYRNPWSETDPAALAQLCAHDLARVIQTQGADTIAAVVAEPVQGAGGVIVPHASYWPMLRALCTQHNILLISDEVVTGFGRIGSMCGARHWGVVPDIMALAKGINSGYVPLGATLLSQRVARAYAQPNRAAPLMHGYTYSGHALACAAANANLQIVQDTDLPGQAARVGAYLNEQLLTLMRYPHVGDVRGLGLMAAVELVADRQSKAPLAAPAAYVQTLVAQARAAGALIRVQGNRVILSPPLVFTPEHVNEAMAALHHAFAAAENA